MKTSPLTEHITRLTLFGCINCYMVREEDGLTLIDAAIAPAASELLKYVESVGLPIRRIVLTHAHMDHVGSLDELTASLAGVEVWMGTRETRLYEQAQAGLSPAKFALEAGEANTPVKGGYPAMKSRITHQFQEGDTIGSLRACFSPGHTPGHMALLDERDRTLLAGDSFVSFGGLRVLGDANPWTVLGAIGNWATWHPMTALESGVRLADMRPERIACGHGEPVTEHVKEKMAGALDHAGHAFAHS